MLAILNVLTVDDLSKLFLESFERDGKFISYDSPNVGRRDSSLRISRVLWYGIWRRTLLAKKPGGTSFIGSSR